MFAFAEKINIAPDNKKAGYATTLRKYAELLGLKLKDDRRIVDTATGAKLVDLMLEIRQSAREKKDFATSDLIRKQLTALNINVMDVAGGKVDWERS
jgi:cysteinyl-tRNA synthetase